jgi:5'-3' exonuclease|tara:strand:- start:31 stop:885 length:855 start_codon:yes stop_codon:yes gene_type:complete
MAIKFDSFIAKETKTLIVDALNLAFRWKHQGKTDFVAEYINTVASFAKSYKCTNIIITADQGSSSYRKRILPEYKQNRKEKYAKQTPEEAEAFKRFFIEYERVLYTLSDMYTVLQHKETEADDLAAYLVKHKDRYNLGDIVLISTDRDWDLLIQEGVMRFSYVTRKEVTMENWNEHYEVPREQYACFKCLTGDKGDNVPGFAGIGPKRATDLLKEYGSAYNIYDSVPIESKYKYMQEINENPDKILRNYELMDLLTHCEDAIGYELPNLVRRMEDYGPISTIYS